MNVCTSCCPKEDKWQFECEGLIRQIGCDYCNRGKRTIRPHFKTQKILDKKWELDSPYRSIKPLKKKIGRPKNEDKPHDMPNNYHILYEHVSVGL